MNFSPGMGLKVWHARVDEIRVRKAAEDIPHAAFASLYLQQLLHTGEGSELPEGRPLCGEKLAASLAQLPASEKNLLHRFLGGQSLQEIIDLSREPDPQIFFHGQLEIARRLEDQDHLEAAQLLYSALASQKADPEISRKAEGRLNALRGVGTVGPRLEFLLSRFAEGATEPAGLAAMVAGGTVFKLTRSLTLGRLFASPAATLVTRGFGAEAAATLFAFSLEIPTFATTAHGLHSLFNPEQAQGWSSLFDEMASGFFVLGGMKLTAWGATSLFNRIHGIDTTGALTRLEGISAFTQRVLPQAGMLGGLMLGHRLETWAGLRQTLGGATTLTDSLVTLLQFNVGGRLNEAALGKGFKRWELELEARTQKLSSLSKFSPPELGRSSNLFGSQGALALADGPRDFQGRGTEEAFPIPGLWMSNERDKLVPVKRGTSSIALKPPPIPVAPIYSLDDFPEIRKTLLPKTLKYLSVFPQLAEDLLLYSNDLSKIDKSLGSREIPGAVPYTARMIAEQMLKAQNPELSLHDNPVAILVAASLATHYEELGDLVGQSIYRDLLTAYRLLREGPGDRYSRAEEIILQNLELDPYNPWFIHLGLSVSLELAELALQKPSFYVNLREDMDKLPEKWKQSIITKAIEKKLTDKNRRNYFKGFKEVGYVYAVLAGSLGFLEKVLTGIALGPGMFIKEFFYLQSLGGKLKRTPQFFEDLKKKTLYEIQLYYGDYKNAAPLAAEGSKLPVVLDTLNRRQMGELLERDIHIEAIPKLHSVTVRQTEPLAQLKKNLANSQMVTLEGLAGSAKTYLAVQLAHELQEESEKPVFWYTFKEGKKPDLARFFNHLAYFIEVNNPKDESGLTERVRERAMISSKVSQLKAALLRNPSVLFLDNFHLALEDEDASAAVTLILHTPHSETKAVTISRRSHESQQQIETQVFQREGMSLEEAESLYDLMGVRNKISTQQMEDAFVLTRGRPMSLILLGELFHPADPPRLTQLLADLQGKNNRAEVLKYLFDQVYDGLPELQQSLLQFLSIFREPVPKSVLSYYDPGDEEAAFKGLISLEEAFLVEEHQPGLYGLHDKYKKLTALRREDRQEYHRRAAYYYWSKAFTGFPSDYLEAGYHYFKAGEYDRAAKMLIGRIDVLLKRGYLGRLEGLLKPLTEAEPLSAADRGALLLELGNYHHFKMEWEKALEDFKRSLSVQQGRKDLPAVAHLYSKIGFTYESTGQWEKALGFYQKSATLLKKLGDFKGLSQVYNNIGLTHQAHQNWEKAESHFKQALQIQKETADKFNMGHTLYNLGLLERDRNQIPQALTHLKESLQLYRETKNPDAELVNKLIQDLEHP